MDFTMNAGWIESTALAMVRIVSFLVIAPPFSFQAFPIRIKGMLAVALAIVVAPRVAANGAALDTAEFIGALIAQILVGGTLGFLVFAAFAMVQSAGGLIDLFAGFTLAEAFDPGSQVVGAQFTRLMQMIALCLLFVSGGYALILGGLFRTFDALPVTGGWNVAAPVPELLGVAGQVLLSAVQIAGPLLLVLFLADVGLGLLTRVAPALNAFSLGFPLKILVTLALAGIVLVGLPSIVASIVDTALNQMQAVL
jgi:flagellar biosynthetic protein FliR